MKKVGEPMVLRGHMVGNVNGHRVQIFDGKYTTGYRIEEFKVIPRTPTNDNEIFGKIHTSKTTDSVSSVNLTNTQELAWAVWNAPSSSRPSQWSLIDPDNMIIEDLYLSNYYASGETSYEINYYIVLQKYEFKAWDGAGILVANLAQAGPQ